MNESDADYYQRHKDDEQEWGEPEGPSSPTRRLATMISVRFSPEEAVRARAAASAAGESVSSFIRTATLERCRAFLVNASPPGGVSGSASYLFGSFRTLTGAAVRSVPTPEPIAPGLTALSSTA